MYLNVSAISSRMYLASPKERYRRTRLLWEKDRNIDMHKRNIERKKTRMKWSSRKRRATWTIWCPSTSNIKTRQQRHIMPHIFLRTFEAFKLFLFYFALSLNLSIERSQRHLFEHQTIQMQAFFLGTAVICSIILFTPEFVGINDITWNQIKSTVL